jgi:glycerol-3-phosphate acyltransferase PlsY
MMISLFILLAYLFGSLNFAIIICKLAKLPDPRKEGSHNPGATNVLRLGGKRLAVLVVAGDLLKAVIPVLIARFMHIENMALSIIAMSAVLGHMYPIFFRFEGGKGIATTLGALFALSLYVGLADGITWIIIAYLFRYSSLASLVAMVLAPIFIIIFSNSTYVLPMIVIVIIIVIKHRANIQRLLKGTEPTLGKK